MADTINKAAKNAVETIDDSLTDRLGGKEAWPTHFS